MSIRLEKVSNLIKEEISLIFLHKIQDPALGLVTVTNVRLTPDLKLAKVYFSVFEKENRDSVLEKINDIKGLIKSELARKVSLKTVPDLMFYIDDTLDYVEKMEGLFKKIHDDDNESNEDNN